MLLCRKAHENHVCLNSPWNTEKYLPLWVTSCSLENLQTLFPSEMGAKMYVTDLHSHQTGACCLHRHPHGTDRCTQDQVASFIFSFASKPMHGLRGFLRKFRRDILQSVSAVYVSENDSFLIQKVQTQVGNGTSESCFRSSVELINNRMARIISEWMEHNGNGFLTTCMARAGIKTWKCHFGRAQTELLKRLF